MKNDKKDLNTYLFTELCDYSFEEFEKDISDNWPFQFENFGTIEIEGSKTELYEFHYESVKYYGFIDGGHAGFIAADGVTIDELRTEWRGSRWISFQESVDIGQSRIGDSRIPSVLDRRKAVYELIESTTIRHKPPSDADILISLFLVRTGKYLALVRSDDGEKVNVVGSNITIRNVPYQEFSPYRRLSIAIGRMIELGKIQ